MWLPPPFQGAQARAGAELGGPDEEVGREALLEPVPRPPGQPPAPREHLLTMTSDYTRRKKEKEIDPVPSGTARGWVVRRLPPHGSWGCREYLARGRINYLASSRYRVARGMRCASA
eukprot:9466077-Pyramimonas_sp.AAC.2